MADVQLPISMNLLQFNVKVLVTAGKYDEALALFTTHADSIKIKSEWDRMMIGVLEQAGWDSELIDMYFGEDGMLIENFKADEFENWFDLYELLVRTLVRVYTDDVKGKSMSEFIKSCEEESK